MSMPSIQFVAPRCLKMRTSYQALTATIVFIAALVLMCPFAWSEGFIEIVNKTSLKVKEITPLAQYVGKEQQRDIENNDPELVFFKTGYNINLLNEGKKPVNVKMELIFNNPNDGSPVSYITYEEVEKGKAKTICLMCNHTPIRCPYKNSSKDSRKECEGYTMTLWKDYAKRLVIDNY
jgi:hypothetical protein